MVEWWRLKILDPGENARISTPPQGQHFLWIAPAATRPIVSRAEDPPPPRWSRMPNLAYR